MCDSAWTKAGVIARIGDIKVFYLWSKWADWRYTHAWEGDREFKKRHADRLIQSMESKNGAREEYIQQPASARLEQGGIAYTVRLPKPTGMPLYKRSKRDDLQQSEKP